jgi:hypothetical protein
MNPVCSELNIILYIERELPEAEMLRLEQHLARCADCRQLLREHRLVRLTLIRASEVEVPGDFTARVMAEIPSPFHRFLTTAREKILVAAAAILLAGAGVFSYLAGVSTPNVGAALSLQWWNRIFIQSFTLMVDTFLLVLDLTRLLLAILLFFVEGFVFGMEALGRLILFSPQGLGLFVGLLVLFGVAAALAWKFHPKALHAVVVGRR